MGIYNDYIFRHSAEFVRKGTNDIQIAHKCKTADPTCLEKYYDIDILNSTRLSNVMDLLIYGMIDISGTVSVYFKHSDAPYMVIQYTKGGIENIFRQDENDKEFVTLDDIILKQKGKAYSAWDQMDYKVYISRFDI